MPKKDDTYMNAQREALVKAAVECLLQKGLTETTMRDVAQAADVSLGTLYVHFSDKYELVLAACRLSNRFQMPNRPATTWKEYVSGIEDFKKYLQSPRGRKRIRLSFQVVAELMMNRKNLPGFADWYAEFAEATRSSLRAIHENGEISLPMGLEQTVEAHMFLNSGVIYTAAANLDANLDSLLGSYKLALGQTAGLMAKALAASHLFERA